MPLLLSPPPAFSFYQRRRVALGDAPRTSGPLQPYPYVPQCDALGSWEPVQCHAATGEGAGQPGGGEQHPSFSFWERALPWGQASWTLGSSLAAGGRVPWVLWPLVVPSVLWEQRPSSSLKVKWVVAGGMWVPRPVLRTVLGRADRPGWTWGLAGTAVKAKEGGCLRDARGKSLRAPPEPPAVALFQGTAGAWMGREHTCLPRWLPAPHRSCNVSEAT